MISLVLTPLAALLLAFAVTVGTRIGFVWFGKGREKARPAGFWPVAWEVTRRTAAGWWSGARANCYLAAGHVRGWWERRGSEAPAADDSRGTSLPPPARRPQRQAAPVPGGGSPATIPAAALGPIPPEWAAVADTIAAFEPDDDEDFIGFVRGQTAGLLAVAGAWHDHGDTLTDAIGLEPEVVQAAYGVADCVSEAASGSGTVVRQFVTVYEAVQTWIANDGGGERKLPKRRDFLKGLEG